MTRIDLIRHAEDNLYRFAQGQSNRKLTAQGWDQIRVSSRQFESNPIPATCIALTLGG